MDPCERVTRALRELGDALDEATAAVFQLPVDDSAGNFVTFGAEYARMLRRRADVVERAIAKCERAEHGEHHA